MNNEPSQAAIARALGLAKSRITAMKKQGMPVHSIEAAQAWREARQSIARRKPAPHGLTLASNDAAPPSLELGVSHDEARTRREIAEASMAEMKEAEMRGKYLIKTEVDSAVFEIGRAMRDGLTNCARRIAADVAGLGSAEACEAVIDREHRALLESMAHRIASRLGAPSAVTET